MAIISSSSSSSSPSPSPSSSNTTKGPILRMGETPVIDAWKKALETYKKSLPKKDHTRIQMPTGPGDVVKDIEEWELKQRKSKSRKVVTAVSGGLARLQRFNASIDMLAQGSPAPGCLLWGSIKFVLRIVQDALEEYERLCTAFNRMIECLSWIEIYCETFVDSALVSDCVAAYYVSIIRFWTQACKFYRRGRLWKKARSVWDNYDTEFGLLERNMITNWEKIKDSTAAENVRQMRSARADQKAMNQRLLDSQNSSRKKELTRWLSPTAYEVGYYQDDFKAAIKKRHRNSCQWLLNNAQFTQFSISQIPQNLLLWIHAKPGAGKTVLSSWMIDHYQQQHRTNSMASGVIYFFCKKSDEDKNTDISIIRSLLYQLLEVIESPEYCGTLSQEMEAAMNKSGQHRALEFGPMWSLFAAHISKMVVRPIVVLDALDECKKPKILTQQLRALSKSDGIKVIFTSRKESHIQKLLADELSLEIRAEDIDADIKAFITAKISKNRLLCQNSVYGMIMDKLSANHNGMFLWVYLILKELKACAFVQQVQSTLKKLPEDLPAVYENILQRLCESLKASSLELAKKVFVWVVSASRPLRIKEISEALIFHYQMEGQQSITGDQSFPYAEKDIEQACGSLLTSHEGTLQVIHLTVKEFLKDLTSSTNNSYKQLLVDPAASSMELALVNLNYISQKLTTPIVDINAATNRMDLKVDGARLQNRLEQNPFLEYASFNWLLHSIDYTGDSGDEIAKAIRKTFDSSATFYWIEACLILDSSSFLHRIRLGLEDLVEWAIGEKTRAPPGSADLYQFLSNWCSVVICIINVYGEGIEELPWDVFILDMHEIFSSNGLGKLYNNHGNFKTREPIIISRDDHSKLSQDASLHLRTKPVGQSTTLFIYDHIRKVFFAATRSHDWTLFVQDSKTGRSLPPIVDPEGVSREILSYAMSKDREYLGILDVDYMYDIKSIRISIWKLDSKIEFTTKTRRDNWASKIFDKKSIWKGKARPTIVYRDDGYFYSPIGRIQPTTIDFLPFPPEISSIIDATNPSSDGKILSICFGAKGELYVLKEQDRGSTTLEIHSLQEPGGLFVLKQAGDNRILELSSLQEPFVLENCSPIEPTVREVKASSTGRYLLLQNRLNHREFMYSLYDTLSKKTLELHQEKRQTTSVECLSLASFPFCRCENTPHFEFSKNDCRLFSMVLNDDPRRFEVEVLALNDKEPRIWSHGQFEFDGRNELEEPFRWGLTVDVCSEENTAWIAQDGRLYQMNLGPLKVSFPKNWVKNFQRENFRISSDGTRLSVLHYGDSKAQIQTFHLNTPGKPVRYLDLDWPHCESISLAIEFSSDLSVLVCGDNLFHLAAEDCLASKPLPVSPRPRSNISYHFNGDDWLFIDPEESHIFISDKNPSTAYINLFYQGLLSIYKVDMSSRCSAQVDISGIDMLSVNRATLHPSLPIMLFQYRSGKFISTLDLRNLNVKHFEILPRYNWTRFSECGTFIISDLRSPHGQRKEVLLGKLQIEPNPIRVIQMWRRWSYYSLRSSPAWYIRIEFEPVFRGVGISSDRADRRVDEIICSIPSYVDRGSIHLLFGPTDDDFIRVLYLSKDKRPLEVRSIRLTFSELRARLIHKWELKYGEPYVAETVEVHPNAAAARVLETPGGSSSADTMPSDLITWFPGVLEEATGSTDLVEDPVVDSPE